MNNTSNIIHTTLNDKLRLSFIVPFYNTEPYIEQCIRSLYDQDIPMEEYEVICVDDCSPDWSRAIVERLQKEYPTLKLLIHTENKRQGGARNTGVREAKGRYIWFVDSDDYIEPNCIGALLQQAEGMQLDILKFFSSTLQAASSQPMYASEQVTTGSVLIFDTAQSVPILERCCSPVMQLIRREYLVEQAITFAEGIQYEDDDYGYRIYALAERAFAVAVAPYVVRVTPNSTTRRKHDYRRARDIYAQAIRMARLDASLSKLDARWHTMITMCIDDCINNCVFRILKGLSLSDQMHFWLSGRKQWWKLRPYLSNRSFAKLSSFMIWKML